MKGNETGAGRPPVADPLKLHVAVRINRALRERAEKYRNRHGLRSVSIALRHAAEATFRREDVTGQ